MKKSQPHQQFLIAKLLESRGKRLGTTDFTAFQSKAREKGVSSFRAVLEPARRVLKEQPFLAGDQPAYPDYALAAYHLAVAVNMESPERADQAMARALGVRGQVGGKTGTTDDYHD